MNYAKKSIYNRVMYVIYFSIFYSFFAFDSELFLQKKVVFNEVIKKIGKKRRKSSRSFSRNFLVFSYAYLELLRVLFRNAAALAAAASASFAAAAFFKAS